jgi:uncharacterized protein (TIGR02001 family)
MISRIFLPIIGFLGIASAYAESPHVFGGSVTLTTEYVYQGLSLSDEKPAIQGGLDYVYTPLQFYAGIWSSTIDFDADDGGIEIDYFGGFEDAFGNGLGWDVGIYYTSYPRSDDTLEFHFLEFYSGLLYNFDSLPSKPSTNIYISYTDDEFGVGTDDSVYIYGQLDFSLPYDMTLGLHGGYKYTEGEHGFSDFDYLDWKINLSKQIIGFVMDFSYTTTTDQADACGFAPDICDGRITVSLSKFF